MNQPIIGVNLFPTDQMRDLNRFERSLEHLVACGFDAVELPLHGMEAIRNGRLDQKRLKQYTSILQNYDLKMTTHAPYDLNLFRKQDPKTELLVFEASIEMSGALGASVMTYHPARFVGEEQFFYPQTWDQWTPEEMESAKAYERGVIRQLADLAQTYQLKIGMENIRPYPDCPFFCYSIHLDELLEQVRLIDHPSVGITLDVGHLHLSGTFLQMNIIEAVKRAKSQIVHLHLHDNFGKPCFSAEKNQFNLMTFGRGDMHMPIGTGNVPLQEIMNILGPTYTGVWMHEIRERYTSDLPELIAKSHEIFRQIPQPILHGAE